MRFVDEFRNEVLVKSFVKKLQEYIGKDVNIMEVCGTHTMSIFRYGIRGILPKKINIISGPGCPVCVTPQSYIDTAIELASRREVIIATFGDMMRIPGKKSSLLKKKTDGADIRIVYSPMDTMQIAKNNSNKKIVFLSVGFETTTPLTALTAMEAKKKGINNLLFLTAHKIVSPVMETLVQDKELKLDGFLLPGHVSAIIGTKAYEFLSEKYNMPGVVAGFEPTDILQGIISLINMVYKKEPQIINEYKRIVRSDGNLVAVKYLNEVFDIVDTRWRGIGIIPKSGYIFNKNYEEFDALRHFQIEYEEYDGNSDCRCGEIIKGKIIPLKCPLFKRVCTPENPIGACMVSSEGACAAFYRYGSEK